MGSPEKPVDVEMGDMTPDGKLKEGDIEAKQDDSLLEKKEEEKEPKRFTGLKKDELLAISSKPHWVRARWALFIIFWIAWVAMLVGAILIVVNAPRCKPEPVQQWYKDDVVYEVDAKQFADGFKGTEDRLPYIKSKLHSKIVLLTGVTNKQDVATVVDGQKEAFSSLVDAIHKDKKGKVMIDMVVDSLSTSSKEFLCNEQLDCSTNADCKYCDLFIWTDGNSSMADENRKYSESHGSLYRVNSENNALLDFSKAETLVFIEETIRSWFVNHQIDGVKIRDLSQLQNIDSNQFVTKLWDNLFSKNDTTRALYVYSSSPNAGENPVTLKPNDTNTEHSPVYLTSLLIDSVDQAEAGKNIQTNVNSWRSQSRSVSGFVVSPLSGPLAAKRFPKFAAGLNLLAMALPGLPILRSGDELASVSPDFTWKKTEDFRDSFPLNGSEAVLSQTSELIVRTVDGIQAKQSLRYDTRDADTTFVFLDTGNNDIVAFKRKWDQKSAVLVVSNMSPTNHTVNLKVKDGLMSGKNLADKAKITVTSIPSYKPENLKLSAVDVWSGLTLVLENV